MIGSTIVYSPLGIRTVEELGLRSAKATSLTVIRPRYAVTPLECAPSQLIYVRRNDKLQAVPASSVTTDDWMVYPIVNHEEHDDISEDDCRFYGMLVAFSGTSETSDVIVTAHMHKASWLRQYLTEIKIDFVEQDGTFTFASSVPQEIPPKFFQVSNAKVLKLIGGIMTGPYFKTQSRKLMESIRYLLLRLGVPTEGNKNREGQYEITVPGDALIVFQELGLYPSWEKQQYFVKDGYIFHKVSAVEIKENQEGVLLYETPSDLVTHCGLVGNSCTLSR